MVLRTQAHPGRQRPLPHLFELGPGRGQIQCLASLFHPDTPNDTAPAAYNAKPAPGLPTSPLEPRLDNMGFRWRA